MRKNLIKSVSVRAFSGHVYESMPERYRDTVEECINLYEAGAWAPTITQTFALADIRAAHEVLDAGKVLGKMVLKP